jgi:hypothetical protein
MKLAGQVFSLRATVLFLAGLVLPTAPMAAQQEVSPEHFDAKQGAAPARKPALAHKTAADKKKPSPGKHNAAAQKPTSKPEESAALKPAPAPSSR